MIELDAEVEVSAFAAEDIVLEAVEIDGDGNHTTVLLQIVVLRSDIRCLETAVFLLVCCLVDVVFEDE